MTQLLSLQSEIAVLRHKRQSVRFATAYCGVVSAMLWTLAAAFFIDYMVEGGLAFRGALLAGVVAIGVWAWQRYAKPWLRQRESILDVALLVEDQLRAAREPLGRDLVAALQFESPEAAEWGSVALERVVVADVARESEAIDVMSGVPTEVLARRALIMFVTVGIAVAAIAFFPGHAVAFINRLFLGRMHYPSATQIDKIVINGKELPPAIGREPVPVACPQGQPLEIQVFGTGELPERGRMELAITADRKLTIDLPAVVKAEDLAEHEWTAYVGKLDRLNDSARYQIFLGDAWTDPARIELVPMPVVDCRLIVAPPEYARAALANQRNAPSPGSRNLEVLEGSRVIVEVTCHNKPLASVAITIGDKHYPLVKTDEASRQWRLEPAGTPFAAVASELDYKIAATDEDALAPERSPQGTLRIKMDRPPRISAQVKTKYVLPTGKPVIEFRADDDYAVARIEAKATVLRETAGDPERLERPPLVVATGSPTIADANGQPRAFVAPLAALGLQKGDRLELVFEAIDYRGDLAGKSTVADPLVFYVTDVAGIESAVTEIDPVLEQQIQSLIQDQLGIGESK
jgi:hypothetical protein